MAISPKRVSGLVVATVINLSELSMGYFMYHMVPFFSCLTTSRSETAVLRDGSQFTNLYPL